MTDIPDINRVWERIKSCQEDVFHTITGKEFSYTVAGEVLRVDRAEQNLPKSQFAKALQCIPISKPGEIVNTVRGPSYIWAILYDKRIRRNEWQ